MSIFDAVLGRFFSSGVELELGAGVNCISGITASRNASTGRIDLAPDAPLIHRSSYTFQGDVTVDAASTAVAMKLDGSATSIPIGDIVADGNAVDIHVRIKSAKSDGTALVMTYTFDLLIYRETSTSEIHLVDLNDDYITTKIIGTGTQTISVASAVKAAEDWAFAASYSGSLTITSNVAISDARNNQVTIWVGEAWSVPTS